MKLRLRPKFRLRTLLIIMTLCCCVLGWYVNAIRTRDRERRIFARLFPPHYHSREFEFLQADLLPEWLQWLPLSEKMTTTVSLDLSGRNLQREKRLSASDINDISQFSNLKRLALWRTDVSMGDLDALTGLRKLEVLDVQQCPNLDQDELASRLWQWPQLQRVRLGNAMECLALDHFTRSKLEVSGVDNDGLKHLANHPNKPAEILKVRCFNELSLGFLLKMKRLRSLEVELASDADPQILNELYRLPKLKRLRVIGIEAVDLPLLQAKRPKLGVSFAPHEFKDFHELAVNWLGNVHTIGITFGELNKAGEQEPSRFEAYRTRVNTFGVGLIHVSGISNRKGVILSGRISEFGRRAYYTKGIKRIFVQRTGRLVGDPIPYFQRRKRSELTYLADSELKRTLKALESFYHLKELTLRNLHVADYNQLQNLKPLEHLSIECGPHSREVNLNLKLCPELRSLTVVGTEHLDRNGIIGWNDLKKLKRIHLSGNHLGDQSLTQIAKIKSLEELVIKDFQGPLSKESAQRLAELTDLKTCYITDIDGERLDFWEDRLPNLTNYVGRLHVFDPAEPLYPKAFASLPDDTP